MNEQLLALCRAARQASYQLATESVKKDEALLQIAQDLISHQDEILLENQQDVSSAQQKGLSSAMVDRLTLTEERIQAISASVRKVVSLPDPCGKGECFTRPNGLCVRKMRVPIGVIGIIYEARPNVTADAAVLCVKSGNAVILRGGSEAIRTNLAVVRVIQSSLAATGLPRAAVQIVEDTSRETASALMKMHGAIDVLIPRGGSGLIRTVVEQSTVPVIETGAGNCHLYVDADADLQMATDILFNAKTSRPSVCNAVETLLVHQDIAGEFLPLAKEKLDAKAVQLRGCTRTLSILPDAVAAQEEDFWKEYNDYVLAVKVVDGFEQAVEHINHYGTKHSEAIVTRNMETARQFQSRVDAAVVFVNASTRFTDGEELGLGAEIGISTQKLHARGPMGLEALTTVKYLIDGNGQVR